MRATEFLRHRRDLAIAAPLSRALGGPRLWLAGPGVLERAGGELLSLGPPLAWVGEARLWKILRPRLEKTAWGARASWLEFPQGGECCEKNIAGLAGRLKRGGFKALAAFGGGKCLDTAKLAACRLNLPLATVPGSAATCACATAVAVLHSRQGEFLEVVDLPRAPDLCLVDYNFLLTAPGRLLAAGMADTLAKWLELEAVRPDMEDGFSLATGLALARQAYDIVLEHGQAALRGNRVAWQKAVEANLLLSALASLAGGGLAAAAHSLADGLSLVPGLKNWLHGELVGVGLLFQDRLLKRLGRDLPGITDPRQREACLKRLGLKTRLPLRLLPDSRLRKVVAKAWAEGETIHLLPGAGKLKDSDLRMTIQQLCG